MGFVDVGVVGVDEVVSCVGAAEVVIPMTFDVVMNGRIGAVEGSTDTCHEEP